MFHVISKTIFSIQVIFTANRVKSHLCVNSRISRLCRNTIFLIYFYVSLTIRTNMYVFWDREYKIPRIRQKDWTREMFLICFNFTFGGFSPPFFIVLMSEIAAKLKTVVGYV